MAASHAQLEISLEQALIDDLTGLPSRALFLQQAEQLRLRNATAGMATAVLFMDLDGFKAVNDQFGHGFGDRVLVQFAEVLRSCLRETDIVGRFGGDEFVVCLTASAAHIDATAARIAEHMVQKIEEMNDGIGCSVGIKICPAGAFEVEAAILQADKAMYAAKNQGRNRAAARGRPRLVAVS
jgi:diguanylate cyclase (GGDEF)-like protein